MIAPTCMWLAELSLVRNETSVELRRSMWYWAMGITLEPIPVGECPWGVRGPSETGSRPAAPAPAGAGAGLFTRSPSGLARHGFRVWCLSGIWAEPVSRSVHALSHGCYPYRDRFS